MKKTLSLILALIATTFLWAYDFQSSDLYYNITSDTTVEVTSKSSSYPYNEGVTFTTATIPETVTYDGITYSVTSIGDRAFCDCSCLISITITDNVTTIGEGAFECCSSLTSVDIPYGVTAIRDWAFFECISLVSATIPNSVISIGNYAFNICYSLSSITIPSSVVIMGFNPFAHCSSLLSIIVDKANTIYDSRENCNAIIETATNTLIAGCENTIIPYGVITIGPGAFSSCKFTSSLAIPNSVTSIGENAFHYCSFLTSIIIPNSVTSIREGAFSYCSSLTSVTCLAMTPPTLGDNVFDECDNPTLFVPCEAFADYQAHEQWGQFTNIQCIASEDTPTDIENTDIQLPTDCQKFLHDGQVYILQDGKTYTITGQKL